jgi:hypothetical protein
MTEIELRTELEKLRRELSMKRAECEGLRDKLTIVAQTNEQHLQTIASMDALLQEVMDEPPRREFEWEMA